MTANVSIQQLDGYLRITIIGDVHTVREVIEYSARYRAVAQKSGIKRVLFDYTEARFHLDYHDLLEIADYATERDFHLDGLRTVVVCLPEHLAQRRQYETIAANRSISYRVFTDEAEALARLMEP